MKRTPKEFILSVKDNLLFIHLPTLRMGRPGFTPSFGECLAEAASVCLLDRRHSSPTSMKVAKNNDNLNAEVIWETPTHQSLRCWKDEEVATEHGAYGIAALFVEHFGLEVIERSRKGSGFDFWLGAPGKRANLFQGLTRLEVSGIRSGDHRTINSRVRLKLNQTAPSDGPIPAVIIVVEFGAPTTKAVWKT